MSDQPTRNDKRDDRLGLNPGEQPPDYGREDFPYAKPSETDSERAYRLLAEDMKADGLISDYDMQPQPDYDYLDDEDEDEEYPEPGYEDDASSSDYSAGFQDGYDAGQRSLRWRYLLTMTIPYRWRARWWSLRRKLFPDNRESPF